MMGPHQIVGPHCQTPSAFGLATLGAAGRTVRCSRCKEVWLARPEDAVDMAAPVAAMAEAGAPAAGANAAAEWEALAREDDSQADETPVVDSPSIAGGWQADAARSPRATGTEWTSAARHRAQDGDAADQ